MPRSHDDQHASNLIDTQAPPFLQSLIINMRYFRWLLLFGTSILVASWMADNASGLLSVFDAIALPVCLGFFLLVYGLTYSARLRGQWLYQLIHIVIALYLIGNSIWLHLPENGPNMNAAQWLGINYVLAYLFLDVRKIVPLSAFIFTITLGGHLVVLLHYYSLDTALGVAMNMGLAHIVYIGLLWTVLKMRVDGAQRQQQISNLEQHAHIDVLTQILNRRGLEIRLEKIELNWKVNQHSYAMLLIDIDHFKKINDRYGHLMGDKALAGFANCISQMIRPTDVFGRWGGEEFVLVTFNKPHEQVMTLAERIRRAIENSEITGLGSVSASIGIAYGHEATASLSVFNIADNNLYIAKKSGRNRCVDSEKAQTLELPKIFDEIEDENEDALDSTNKPKGE
jgi:diguanylate cyclase (GGDEF)-like protein